jgi:hypothetical protein
MIKKLFKFVAGSILVLILVVAGVLGYEYYQSQYWQGQKGLVLVEIEYSEAECKEDRPLQVTATNGSAYIVNKIEWDLGLFNPGYSTDLVTSGYHEFSHDKILKQSESWKYCIAVPKTDGAIHVRSFDDTKDMSKVLKDLLYTIQNKYVTFDKKA